MPETTDIVAPEFLWHASNPPWARSLGVKGLQLYRPLCRRPESLCCRLRRLDWRRRRHSIRPHWSCCLGPYTAPARPRGGVRLSLSTVCPARFSAPGTPSTLVKSGVSRSRTRAPSTVRRTGDSLILRAPQSPPFHLRTRAAAGQQRAEIIKAGCGVYQAVSRETFPSFALGTRGPCAIKAPVRSYRARMAGRAVAHVGSGFTQELPHHGKWAHGCWRNQLPSRDI